ncbi:MAG: porin [Proteobacteria bacterium]|nr:porin [Pseudomonadota bacterium]
MKTKLLAIAVAGTLAAPGLALAQSSVTISGYFKVSLENMRIGSPAAARTGLNTSETRLADDFSRIIFNVAEDLGGGLQAIGQAEMRWSAGAGNLVGTGNTHVGLRSTSLGRVFFGRQDVHYGNTESNLTSLAGDLRADSISLLAFMRDGTTAIANASRTPNIIHYTTPSLGGFTAIVAYSTGSPAQADLTSTVRRGNAWNINPYYATPAFQVGYSFWNQKADGGGATLATGDQRSNRLYGSFKAAGFKVGLAWDKSTVRSTAGGAELGNRTAWSIPVGYTFGNNQIHAHYTRARDDRSTAAQDGAKMFALSYQYTLSKRTSVGLTYAKITNDAAAAYNFFTTTSVGNSAGAAANAGEDPRLFAATIRHAF